MLNGCLVTASLLVALTQKIPRFYLDGGVFDAKLIVQLHTNSGEESIAWISCEHD